MPEYLVFSLAKILFPVFLLFSSERSIPLKFWYIIIVRIYIYISIARDHVCMEDQDENYMLLWPSIEVGDTHYITEPCAEGVANIV